MVQIVVQLGEFTISQKRQMKSLKARSKATSFSLTSLWTHYRQSHLPYFVCSFSFQAFHYTYRAS